MRIKGTDLRKQAQSLRNCLSVCYQYSQILGLLHSAYLRKTKKATFAEAYNCQVTLSFPERREPTSLRAMLCHAPGRVLTDTSVE